MSRLSCFPIESCGCWNRDGIAFAEWTPEGDQKCFYRVCEPEIRPPLSKPCVCLYVKCVDLTMGPANQGGTADINIRP